LTRQSGTAATAMKISCEVTRDINARHHDLMAFVRGLYIDRCTPYGAVNAVGPEINVTSHRLRVRRGQGRSPFFRKKDW